MAEQEKLDILISGFERLEESRKDYIRELTQKLADIHSGNWPAPLAQGQNQTGGGMCISLQQSL